MRLNEQTIRALQYKSDVAKDSGSENEWVVVAKECDLVIEIGTVEALRKAGQAKEELEDYIKNDDVTPKERKSIIIDLCKSGHYPQHEPNVINSRKIKTRTVDKVKYVTGL